jgi:hypothetical protein
MAQTPSRQPAGAPSATGGQFAASERQESQVLLDSWQRDTTVDPVEEMRNQIAEALENQMGCGPGEYIMGTGVGYDGEPLHEPVGQMCVSNAHNHAYWNGGCHFAHDMAAASTEVATLRVRAVEAKMERLVEAFDRADAYPVFTGDYAYDTGSAGAWHEAARVVHSIADGPTPPAPSPSPDPWALSDEPPF